MELSPSIYEHAAAVIGREPWEVSRDPELLYAAHAAAYRVYRHSPVMPGIDIYNLEAEAYGARVERPSGVGIPAIRVHPLTSVEQVSRLPPLHPGSAGRIPQQLAVARRLADALPDTQVRVPVSGPFSIAVNLVGFENVLSQVALEPALVAAALQHLVQGQLRFTEAIAALGLDVAFFESAACPPLLSPAAFRRIELPALKMLLGGMAEILGHAVPCIIGGNTASILDAILETGTRYVIAPFETDQQKFLDLLRHRDDVRVRINSDVELIARGTWEQLRGDADRIVRIAGDRSNVCAGTGALPYETPPANVLRLRDYLQSLPVPASLHSAPSPTIT